MKALTRYAIIILCLVMIIPAVALADSGLNDPLGIFKILETGLYEPPAGAETAVQNTIVRVIQFLLGIAGAIALGVVIWGGIMYMLSLGDAGRASKAKTIILYALLGLFIVVASYIIVSVVAGLIA